MSSFFSYFSFVGSILRHLRFRFGSFEAVAVWQRFSFPPNAQENYNRLLNSANPLDIRCQFSFQPCLPLGHLISYCSLFQCTSVDTRPISSNANPSSESGYQLILVSSSAVSSKNCLTRPYTSCLEITCLLALEY